MSARPRDPRAAPDPAVRDDDPARRSSPGPDGTAPTANPQAAADGEGRNEPRHAARAKDLRFGLLPALLLSLAVHVTALAAMDRMHFGPESADEPARLALRGTGARGEPGGGDGILISVRSGGGPAGAPTEAPREVAPEAPREVVVEAEPAPKAQEVAEAQPASPIEPAPVAPPSVKDVASVAAFAAPSAPVEPQAESPRELPHESRVAELEPVATTGEWEGAPVPADWTSGSGDTGAVGIALAAGASGDGGAGAGQGVGPGPGGNNGNGVLAPNPLAGNTPPDYPWAARRAGEEGLVLVRAHVAADGSVSAVELAAGSGHDRLDQAALDAVAAWLFEPARRAGRAVAQVVEVPIRFSLRPR